MTLDLGTSYFRRDSNSCTISSDTLIGLRRELGPGGGLDCIATEKELESAPDQKAQDGKYELNSAPSQFGGLFRNTVDLRSAEQANDLKKIIRLQRNAVRSISY